MPYGPPAGNAANLNFTGAYSSPAGNAANFAFSISLVGTATSRSALRGQMSGAAPLVGRASAGSSSGLTESPVAGLSARSASSSYGSVQAGGTTGLSGRAAATSRVAVNSAVFGLIMMAGRARTGSASTAAVEQFKSILLRGRAAAQSSVAAVSNALSHLSGQASAGSSAPFGSDRYVAGRVSASSSAALNRAFALATPSGSIKTQSGAHGKAVLTRALHGRALASNAGHVDFSNFARLRARASAASRLAADVLEGIPSSRALSDADPLWVAVELDLFDRIAPLTPDGLTTIRLSNRGPLTRTVGGVLYQYEPRLHVPILLGTTLTIFSGGGGGSGNTEFSMFQQPLRGQPNGGTISWALDPEFANDLNFGRYRWLGRTFRVYEGITPTDIGVDVDGSGLTLVYTGHIAGLTYDLASNSGPVATIQTTDASSDLDKTLVDDLYPSSFPIVTLQGKTKPELRGRALSIEPVLEDQANLIYRVTRVEPGVVELDDVTELRVGGVPWERVAGGPRVQTYLVIGQAGVTTAYLMFYAYPADVAYWQNAGISITLSSSLPPLQPGGALYNIVQNINGGPSYIGALTPADIVWWEVMGSSTVTPYTGTPPPPSGIIPPPPLLSGPAQGQWAADLASGTVQLGSVTGGAEVRVDAQAVGWETLDTAQLITDICTDKGVPVDPAYMAQLRIDWPGLTSYFTSAGEGKNTLDAIDEITLGNLCWWSFGSDGAVIAGLVDGPNDLVSDFVLFGANPQIPLDVNRLPNGMNAIDPVPKELASNSLTQILPPAWRARLGYAKRWSPGSQFLGGITDEEQSFWRAPELVEDFTDSAGGWSLSPEDGAVIRQEEPRAQDLYISTLAWREAEAQSLRTHLVRRITTNADREIYDVTAWMPAAQIKLFQTITKFWLDANARTQAVYVGTFRATSVIRSIGGGAQQLELWGGSNAFAAARSSSFSGAQMAPLLQGIAFTVFTLGFSSRAGSVVAIVNVRTSNGAPFGGVYSFGAPFNDSGGLVRFDIVTPTNVNIVLARDLSLADVGAHSVTVSATFNTTTVSNSFTFTINQAPGVEP